MKKVLILISLLSGALLAASCGDDDPAPRHATVTGFVYVAGTRTPIPGVRVSVTDKGISETKMTDDKGTFVFEDVRTNTYEFNFEKEGFIQVHTPLRVSLNGPNHLDVPMTPLR